MFFYFVEEAVEKEEETPPRFCKAKYDPPSRGGLKHHNLNSTLEGESDFRSKSGGGSLEKSKNNPT